MNKFINSSKFGDELVFISNLAVRAPLREDLVPQRKVRLPAAREARGHGAELRPALQFATPAR